MQILALVWRALNPARTVPEDPDTAHLGEFVARRSVLIRQIRAEKNRAKTTRDLWISEQIIAFMRVFEEHLAAVEGQIETLIAKREALATQSGAPVLRA